MQSFRARPLSPAFFKLKGFRCLVEGQNPGIITLPSSLDLDPLPSPPQWGREGEGFK